MDLNKSEHIVQVVGAIPAGKVATYGQVAKLAGLPGAARLVGSTLKNLPKNSKLPWHRVLNAAGKLSLPMDGGGKIQKQRLEKEGLVFINGRINLKRFQWNP